MFANLRLRLALWYAGVFGVVLVAFALAIYAFFNQALYGGVEVGARTVAASMLNTIVDTPQGPRVNRAAFEDNAGDASFYQGVAAIEILDAKGRVLAHYGVQLAPSKPGGSEDETQDASGNPLWIHSQPVVMHGQDVGLIRIARPLSDVARTLRRFATMLFVLVPIALVFTVAGGVLLAGKVMDPIREAFDRLRRFTADASHELRTPLAVMQAHLEAIAAAPPEDAESLRQALEPAQRAGARMNRLVGDLLFLARSDASAEALAVTRLDLDELVEAAVEEYAALAEAKGLALHFEGAPISLNGDPQRLHQLVANLIENAIKYTDSGAITVRVAAQSAPASAVVSVADTGVGIAEEHLPRIFDRFYRTDDARSGRRPGTGLGLSIVRAIVYAHRGEIRVKSELGKGTQFTVMLPQG